MYIDMVPGENSPPAILLRESFRENGKVKKRSPTGLSNLPADVVENLRLEDDNRDYMNHLEQLVEEPHPCLAEEDIPVVLCTCFSEKTMTESAGAIGIKAFIIKPNSHW